MLAHPLRDKRLNFYHEIHNRFKNVHNKKLGVNRKTVAPWCFLRYLWSQDVDLFCSVRNFYVCSEC